MCARTLLTDILTLLTDIPKAENECVRTGKQRVSMPGVAPLINRRVMNEVLETSPLIRFTKVPGRAERRTVFVALIGSQVTPLAFGMLRPKIAISSRSSAAGSWG